VNAFRTLTIVTLAIAALAAPVVAHASERVWWGGGIGFGFGDVDYIEVTPTVGFVANDEVTVGAGLLYRYRDDERYLEDLSTNDYGANVFVRYDVFEPFYLHVEYEYLSYEWIRFDLSTDRDDFHSILAGPGYSKRFGGLSGFYVQALYNFSYDSDDLDSPYDDEWVYRAGFTFGF
jgi:hypothetical protein